LSVPQLSKLHGISDVNICNWIYKFYNFNKKGIRIVEMTESSAEKLKQLERKIRDLEQIVGEKQIKIDYLERLIDVAESELKVDIKKTLNLPKQERPTETIYSDERNKFGEVRYLSNFEQELSENPNCLILKIIKVKILIKKTVNLI